MTLRTLIVVTFGHRDVAGVVGLRDSFIKLIGRDQEQRVVGSLLAAARDGTSGTLVIAVRQVSERARSSPSPRRTLRTSSCSTSRE